ncbi:MAG: histone deacetylase [Gammaproteobacteria bacterium]|nr:histone deacetylase [Gammaproteobacteria bacterium]
MSCLSGILAGSILTFWRLASSADAMLAVKRIGAGTGYVFETLYMEHWLSPGHPESPMRLAAIRDKMEDTGLVNDVVKVRPLDNVHSHLLRVHDEAHIASIRARYGKTHIVAMHAVAGALAAVTEVCEGRLRNAFCAVRPPGHHAANTGKEEGFCFYNTVAVAARYAQAVHGINKVLIIDWDYHHGNATEAVFYDDPTVLYFSTHDYHAYPGTGDPRRKGAGPGYGYNINVHLDCGATDADIVSAFDQRLLPAADVFEPDLVLISAGFDSRKDDLLGCFDVTDDGYVAITQRAMDIAGRHCRGRLVSVLEGGYNLDGLASSVAAHVETLLTYSTDR